MSGRSVRWAFAVALLASVACGREEASVADPAQAAHANGIARIDGHAIDAADLSLSGDLRRDRRALDALVARNLAAREARARGLDLDANTQAQLAAIRREAAAREEEALRDALAAKLRDELVLTDDELRAHYDKTRTRYTERRIALRRQRFATEAQARALDASVGSEGRLDPAKAETIAPAVAEKLPPELIPDALRLGRAGERAVVVRDGSASIVELVAIEPAAQRSFEEARADVEKSLRTLRAQAAFRAEIERLRAAAKVEIDEAALRITSRPTP